MKSLPGICFRIALLAPLAFSIAASAHEVDAPSPSAGLGALSFATSAKSHEAQATFVRAALLLHLFEYDDAAKAFAAAQAEEPDFVMAVWGEAMTHNHPLWNQLDETAGRDALAKLGKTPAARTAKARTAREKAYLSAVEILYSGVGTKLERDQRYLDAMMALAKAYPDDNQAQLFYALALEGRSQGVRNVSDYLKAAAIAKRVYGKNPLNPGAAHYWIHGMDDPENAHGAIEAARALSKIAPDAGHAQHMTSHIFIALGLWDDLVQANEEATRVVYQHAKATGQPEVHCFHYNEWLEYGYFQQGRIRDAQALLKACKRSGDAGVIALKGKDGGPRLLERYHGSLPIMRATAIIESGDWNGIAVGMHVETGGETSVLAITRFVEGYAAAQRDDLDQAQGSLDALTGLIKSAGDSANELQVADYLQILRDSLNGLIASKQGEMDKGLALVRAAAEHQDRLAFDFGPPATAKPPHELLGELLLAAKQPAAAVEAFTRALQLAPLRAQSTLGLARAHAAAGNVAAALESYSKLTGIWHAADKDLAGLSEARHFVELHATP